MSKGGRTSSPKKGLWLLEEIHRLTEAVEARLHHEDWEACSKLLDRRQLLLDRLAGDGGLPPVNAWPASQRDKVAALVQGLQHMEGRLQAAWQACYDRRGRELSALRTARRQLNAGLGPPATTTSRHLNLQV